jgi:hypothetical protein
MLAPSTTTGRPVRLLSARTRSATSATHVPYVNRRAGTAVSP